MSAELLGSFAKETLADEIRLLAFDCTVELLLLEKSLKEGRDRLYGLVIKRFPPKTNFSRLFLWYDM
jgi:hypothetical protein